MSEDEIKTPKERLVEWTRKTIEVHGVESAKRNLKWGLKTLEENEDELKEYERIVDTCERILFGGR